METYPWKSCKTKEAAYHLGINNIVFQLEQKYKAKIIEYENEIVALNNRINKLEKAFKFSGQSIVQLGEIINPLPYL